MLSTGSTISEKLGGLTRSHEPLESLLVLKRLTNFRLCFSKGGLVSETSGELIKTDDPLESPLGVLKACTF